MSDNIRTICIVRLKMAKTNRGIIKVIMTPRLDVRLIHICCTTSIWSWRIHCLTYTPCLSAVTRSCTRYYKCYWLRREFLWSFIISSSDVEECIFLNTMADKPTGDRVTKYLTLNGSTPDVTLSLERYEQKNQKTLPTQQVIPLTL